MFFSESEAILGRIHDHLAAWRADGPSAQRLAAVQGEFQALKSAAAEAGFDDISALSHSVENLLAQSGDVTKSEDVGLLNLLEEAHDGLVADMGFVPAVSREHIKAMNSMVASLLGDDASAESVNSPDTPVNSFNECLPQLRSIVEQAAETSGKQVELSLSGGDIQVESRVMTRMMAAFEQLIRHSVEHGIEPAEQRTASGKDAVGHIGIAVFQRGSRQLLEYSDDGAGLDAEKLAAEAVAAGMTDSADEVDGEHLLQILARPAKSDSKSDDSIEAVCRAVYELGGLIALKSESGRGVRFQFQLPAFSGARALPVTVGEYRFAIPAHIIESVIRVRGEEMIEHDGRKYIPVGDRRIPVIARTTLVGGDEVRRRATLLVLLRLADRDTAFEVDAFHDLIDMTPQAPGAQLASIPGVAGVAVLADSSLALILDPDPFIHRELLQRDGLARFPLDEVDLEADSTEKTMRVVVLETAPGPLVIPATLVAGVVAGATQRPSDHQHKWIDGDFRWRGFTVPVINRAAAFAVDEQAKPETHAIILKPMNGGKPDEFFALTGFAMPQLVNIDHHPVATPDDTDKQPQHLLGYVQLDRRLGLIPDLKTLANEIFHER